MNIINTIDLWTEQHANHYECFNGAFVDGFGHDQVAFDHYKIVKNCNCIIDTSSPKINIQNKHHAIVFYKKSKPVRLMVINKSTDIEKCIETALKQFFKDGILQNVFDKLNITNSMIDLHEKPIVKDIPEPEIDVGSCDRWELLYNMLQGLYTETNNAYGNFSSDKYFFMPSLNIKYTLTTDTEKFTIAHKCAFVNDIKTRLIPIQENSPLTT